ncbi:uncharacterized protein [Aegilops tauschii subsp. strangulata]|uniref:uncharacterized protein n=1 Tax=Aegilops tauschii subsp. strangulata TaxID=200361 RepID=UPI001ABCA46B|nr:uncharacterized protein LOC120964305 [Aegilops tauschii subsp. strangulata]
MPSARISIRLRPRTISSIKARPNCNFRRNVQCRHRVRRRGNCRVRRRNKNIRPTVQFCLPRLHQRAHCPALRASATDATIDERDVCLHIISICATKSTHLSFSTTAQNEMAIPSCRPLTTSLPVQGRAKTTAS